MAVSTPLVARPSWSLSVITWQLPCSPIDEEKVEHVHQTVSFLIRDDTSCAGGLSCSCLPGPPGVQQLIYIQMRISAASC